MTLSTGMTAMAKWEEVDGDWYYRKEDGTLIKGKVKEIHEGEGTWYSFDENGRMEYDKTIDLEGGEFYIGSLPGGAFVRNKWALLDAEGHKCKHENGENCDCLWYYYGGIKNVDGKPVGGKIQEEFKEINGKWYAFDPDNGYGSGYAMISDSFIDAYSGARVFYAYPDGHLADRTWVQIDGEWYFFKGLEWKKDEGDEEAQLQGGMARHQTREIQERDGKHFFAFDDDGHMISQAWQEDYKTGEIYYYQKEGRRAVSKWLPIEGIWYHFDDKGNVIEYAGDGQPEVDATPSDAHPQDVEDVEVKGDAEIEVEVGKTVALQFQFLATNSDASRKNFTADHDIYVNKEGSGQCRDIKVSSDGVCTIQYTNDKLETEEIFLGVDEVESKTPITVKVIMPEGKNEEEVIIDSTLKEKPTAENANELANNLKTAYAGLDDTAKENVTKDWVENPDQLGALEDVYNDVNRIEVLNHNVNDKAKEKLGAGADSITMIGGGLNANPTDKVQLKVGDVEEEKNWAEEIQADVEGLTVAFDIKLLFNNEEKTELEFPVIITMPIPKGLSKENLVLYNLHEGGIEEVLITIKGSNVQFLTDKFSTYVFAQKKNDTPPVTPNPGDSDNNTGGSTSGGRTSNGSGASAGQWIQDATGWWFRYTNGSYPANSWQYLPYNGTSRWYHFNTAGYMDSGWFTDTDGHTYYLNPVSDGSKGAMCVGWQQIDGQWYYFNPSAGGPQGSMLKSTTTPDGYKVNEKGQWIR